MKALTGLSLSISASIVLSLVIAPVTHAKSPPTQLEIVVPAYFYPGAGDKNWPALTRAASQTPVTAIINPGSGPGIEPDSNYQAAANAFKNSGDSVIGYVHTS